MSGGELGAAVGDATVVAVGATVGVVVGEADGVGVAGVTVKAFCLVTVEFGF